jgi:hypothetical protein
MELSAEDKRQIEEEERKRLAEEQYRARVRVKSKSRLWPSTIVALGFAACLSAQSTPKIVGHISSVRTVCAYDALTKNHETNEVLFDILDRFYSELEDQFRKQVQRESDIRFAYRGNPHRRLLKNISRHKCFNWRRV